MLKHIVCGSSLNPKPRCAAAKRNGFKESWAAELREELELEKKKLEFGGC